MHPRAVVDRALLLSSLGIVDRETSLVLGVPVRTIRHWRQGDRRSTPPHRPHCPRCVGDVLDDRAYSYLLGLYLGDGHITRGARGVYALSISCANRWPGLLLLAERALTDVMPSSSVCRVGSQGCTVVKSYSTHWPCLFPQHGPGHKHLRTIELVPWQRTIVDQHPEPFVRGLLHSDGCRSTNTVVHRSGEKVQRYSYPRYLFSNRSADVLSLYTHALDQLGIAWRWARPDVVSVARRAAVAALDAFVGPKR